ncbi:hypothetical protein QA649_34535 [Bradyrhizobium sp. CB1717]|uniref:hypothetical protein n=1 Tax=Bradyrhizobium sp. CB1717 TaxID=3039154 RepID=UPI0024B0EA0B|nr:hypothetical protein [Bradyrhizobium sp. CB1717]WFU23161.1 hypothetical protein QA649_34535 [Bradyrhizobium sp. CB1717]
MAEGDLVRRITSTTGDGIDSTTNSVNELGNAVDETARKASEADSLFNSYTMTIGGVSLATVAAVTSMRAFVDFAGGQSQALVDIAEHAELASMSTKEARLSM